MTDSKQTLGRLCVRGHDHAGTGKSLRYKSSGMCIACKREDNNARHRAKKGDAAEAPATKPRKTAAPRVAKREPQRRRGGSVFGLLAEFCGELTVSDFATKLGVSTERVVELVVRGLEGVAIIGEIPDDDDSPKGGGGHAGGGPGGRTPPSGKGPTSKSAAGAGRAIEGQLAAPAGRRIYDALDLPPPSLQRVPVPPAELDVPDEELPKDDDPDPDSPRPAARARGKTIAVHRLTQDELRIGALLWPERPKRPATRGECIGGVRPCPFVGCRYHLYFDVDEANGSIKENYPDLEPWEIEESCALDIADRGGHTMQSVGDVVNVTRERVRQIEIVALSKLKKRAGEDLHDLLQDRPVTVSVGQLWDEAW